MHIQLFILYFTYFNCNFVPYISMSSFSIKQMGIEVCWLEPIMARCSKHISELAQSNKTRLFSRMRTCTCKPCMQLWWQQRTYLLSGRSVVRLKLKMNPNKTGEASSSTFSRVWNRMLAVKCPVSTRSEGKSSGAWAADREALFTVYRRSFPCVARSSPHHIHDVLQLRCWQTVSWIFQEGCNFLIYCCWQQEEEEDAFSEAPLTHKQTKTNFNPTSIAPSSVPSERN